MALLLTDQDLPQLLSMLEAVKVVRAALRERSAGTAHNLLRQAIPVGGGRLVLTPGGLEGQQRAGLRVYAAGYPGDTQITAVWSTETGELDGLVVGKELGVLRTGALGGVAFQLLAPQLTTKVAVIGAGPQACAQLRALLAVRSPKWVEIYRRDPRALAHTAAELREELGVSVTPAANAEAAVRGADVIITATTSAVPVLKAEWVQKGAHISCVGPKHSGSSEVDPELARLADLVVSDFPEQCRSEKNFILAGTPELEQLVDLASLLTSHTIREAEDLTLYFSHGLAGTEVAVAAAALRKAREQGVGTPVPGTSE